MFERRNFECEIVHDVVLVDNSSKMKNVSISGIVFLKIVECYTLIKRDTLEEILTSDSLTSFEKRLSFSFFRISRNVIINMAFVDLIQRKDAKHIVKLKNGEIFEISRRRVKKFVECFKQYICEK